jgi:hypothetical protein
VSKKISELVAATTPIAGDELLEIVQGGVNKKIAAQSLTPSNNASGFGLWKWSTATSGDPGSGKVGSNNATPSAITAFRISELSSDGIDYSGGMSTIKSGDILNLQERGSTTISHRFVVSGAVSDNGTYRTIPVTYDSGIGSLPANNSDTVVRITQTSASSGSSPVQSIIVACSDESTALTVGVAKVTFRMPYAFTLTSVRASLTTAQTSGSILTVDVNEGGTSILSTKLTVDNTEKTSTTAAVGPVISDAALADDAEITIDIDQLGDGTAKGLKIALIGTKV